MDIPFAQLLTAIPQIALGIFQIANASKQAKANVRPTYRIPGEFQQNIDLIKSNIGLPEDVLRQYFTNVGQGTASGINALLATGGNPNMIADLLARQNKEFQNVMLQGALAKKDDLNKLQIANIALAGEKDKAFQVNEYAPFIDKANALAQQKAAGFQNIFGSLNSASGAAANKATEDLLKDADNGVDYTALINALTRSSSSNQNLNYMMPNMSLYGGLDFSNSPINLASFLNPGLSLSSY